ncbi:MAG: hypothetical protein ABT07_02335 [Microbacterium sp. SCN 70-10]|nr:MAG: hypothetical protein ABT07_02335 [Microbacterium sp. SCN 70-10]
MRGFADDVARLRGADGTALEEPADRRVLERGQRAPGILREVHVEAHVHVLTREGARDDGRAQAPPRDVERSARRRLHAEALLDQRRCDGVACAVERKKKSQFCGRHGYPLISSP